MTAPIGVLVRRFPKLSETFILEEVLALERAGVALRLYALEPPSDTIRHLAVDRVQAPVATLPGVRQRVAAHAAQFRRDPWRWLTTALIALAQGRLRAFAAAGWLADACARDGVEHLHAHFVSEPADVARFAARLRGRRYSLSAHAKDIYLSKRADLERRLGSAAFTVTCTELNRRALRDAAPKAAVHRLYHGVDHALFHPQRRRLAEETPLVVSVGRLVPKKGLHHLVAACALLRQRGVAFRCEIVGYGAERARLESLIEGLGLGAQVTLVGKLARDAVIERYARAAVVVQPSCIAEDGDRDGIPNVLLEAMAIGAPVVATRVSGIPELIEHEVDGLLVEPQDPAALADAIERLLAAPALATGLAGCARRTVVERFDNDRNVTLLRRLLDEAQAPRRAVAYVMNGFPRLSETFITHEIHLLEQAGLPLRLFSVKRENERQVHPVVSRIQAPLAYLPEATSMSEHDFGRWLVDNVPTFWPAHRRLLLRHPWRWLSTFAAALALTWRHRPRRVFVKEFLQAGAIAEAVLRDGGVGHLHGHFCHGVATITWFASRLAGLPFSFTAHAKDIYQRELNPGDLLERKLGAARFVATCTCANASVLRERHARPDDIHTVYHGVDTDHFAPAPAAAAPGVPLILAVGRRVEKKGFDDLVAACAMLAREGLAFRCAIVGEPGPADAALRASIAAEGLAERVELRSPVTQDRLRDVYRGARVFALPCRVTADGDRDGFPNVLAEAMACGVPVVSTCISGIPEMIDDGVHGLLVEPGNVAALAGALRRLLADDALHTQLARNGRARICERFDSRHTTRALHALFSAQLAAA
jgi:glycosyltransferase involved in cell wall biosynthesis